MRNSVVRLLLIALLLAIVVGIIAEILFDVGGTAFLLTLALVILGGFIGTDMGRGKPAKF